MGFTAGYILGAFSVAVAVTLAFVLAALASVLGDRQRAELKNDLTTSLRCPSTEF